MTQNTSTPNEPPWHRVRSVISTTEDVYRTHSVVSARNWMDNYRRSPRETRSNCLATLKHNYMAVSTPASVPGRAAAHAVLYMKPVDASKRRVLENPACRQLPPYHDASVAAYCSTARCIQRPLVSVSLGPPSCSREHGAVLSGPRKKIAAPTAPPTRHGDCPRDRATTAPFRLVARAP